MVSSGLDIPISKARVTIGVQMAQPSHKLSAWKGFCHLDSFIFRSAIQKNRCEAIDLMAQIPTIQLVLPEALSVARLWPWLLCQSGSG